MGEYLLAHDLGTSGNKAVLYSLAGELIASELWEYGTRHPAPGFVEQNPDDWWEAVCRSTGRILEKSGAAPGEVLCLSFSAQMMGCLLVDEAGSPLYPMITWADMRAVHQAERMEQLLGMEAVYRATGHRISSSYSAAKLLWLKDNHPELYAKGRKMLQAKDYIIHRLTGNFVTDYSDACGTNLFDLEKKEWRGDFLDTLGIDPSLLPELHPSTDIVGHVTGQAAAATGLLAGTPVVAGGGDGSCACVGAGVVEEGSVYNVIGSSSWISMASRQPVYDQDMQTFNWVHLDETLYAPCGTMQSAGYSFQWAKNTLCSREIAEAEKLGISPYQLIDRLVEESPPGAGGLLFLPYLMGERSPRWNPDAKGCFLGLTIGSNRADILRSVLEGVGYNLKVILDIFDARSPIDAITVIGGGAKGQVWLQILADIWQKKLLVPRYLEEATSMGAVVCGGVGVGAYRDFGAISHFLKAEHTVEPRPQLAGQYNRLYRAFNQAYDGLTGIFETLSAALTDGGVIQ
ncbi:MAG: xylulokinase [Oscillospiraceae bacterium]